MSGYDAFLIEKALIETGLWEETEDELLKPTDSLWENKPKAFNQYDALDLHNLLMKENNQIGLYP